MIQSYLKDIITDSYLNGILCNSFTEGDGLKFYPPDSYIDFGNVLNLQYSDAFSFSFYIYYEVSTGTAQVLYIKADSVGNEFKNGIYCSFTSGNLFVFGCYAGSTSKMIRIASVSAFSQGLHHIVVTKASGATNTFKLYDNGKLISTTPSTVGTMSTIIVSNSAILGKQNTYYPFLGRIHDFKVFNKELNNTEVVELFCSKCENIPSTASANLLINTKFEDKTGITANDSGPNNYDGALNNFDFWVDQDGDFYEYTDLYDSSFINSALYGTIRNSFSEWKFNYSGDYIIVKTNSTYYSINPDHALIYCFVDGVYYSATQFTDTDGYKKINLPAGNKVIQLFESAQYVYHPSLDILGTFMTNIFVKTNSFTKINQTNVNEKLLFITDSIGNGSASSNYITQAVTRLFSIEDDRNVMVFGHGALRVEDLNSDFEKLEDLLISAFSNVTTTKKLIITIGTNDYGAGILLSTFITYYTNLLTTIYAVDPTIQIYCVSPIKRSGETALLGQYRTAISNICTSLGYATYINGYDILELTDLADGLHPSTAGHKKFKDALALTI